MKVRVINTGIHDIYYNLGLDQALAEIVAQTEVPVLRIYSTSPEAISIGCFQNIEDELEKKMFQKKGIDVSRRETGGGLIFHGNQIEISFIVPLDSDFIRHSILESSEDISVAISKFGSLIDVDMICNSFGEIIVDNKLIGTSYQTRKEGVLRQHITFNLDLPSKDLYELLLYKNEKTKQKMLTNIESNFTAIYSELESEVDLDTLIEFILDSFRSAFPLLKFDNSEVTPTEEFLAKKYIDEKYSKDSWRLGL